MHKPSHTRGTPVRSHFPFDQGKAFRDVGGYYQCQKIGDIDNFSGENAWLCPECHIVSRMLFADMSISNAELYELRIIICLRKSEFSVGRTSVCNVTENLEYGMH